MNTDNPIAGDPVSLIAEAGTVGEDADIDAPITDVIRPRDTRSYRYVKKGPLRRIFRYF
jgi:hypothetical protein